MGGNKKMNNNFWSLCIRKIIVMVIFYFLCIMYLGCTTSTIVEIEPGESVELIIVEPQKETPKSLWNWKAREELRKKQKEDKK